MTATLTDRTLARLAYGLFGTFVTLAGVGFALKQRVTPDDIFAIPFVGFTVVGLIVATRRPRNAVGWVFMLVGLTPIIGFVTSAYAYRSALSGGFPLAQVMEWISSWAWFPGIGTLVTFGLLLFPDGRLPSRRWRPVPYLAAGLIFLVTASMALLPGPMEPFDPTLPSNENPFGVESAAGLIETIEGISFASVPLVALLCALSLAFRYRGADSIQRQQIKWFAYSSVMLVSVIMFENVFDSLLGERIAEMVFLMGMILPSVGAGIGILKYRLYDIDLVINRTLVYGLLTAVLALTYLGLVVAMQGVLGGVTEGSDLAVAASTLAVAALFGPLRSWIQAFIDQRFYRRKYDASLTLESFSSRLRDTVDLDSLNGELIEVVGRTMQPAHASLWLRQGSSS